MSRSKKKKVTGKKKGNSPKGAQGRRFSQEERKRALDLMASGMEQSKVATTVGTTPEALRRWSRIAEADGTMPKKAAANSSKEKEADGEKGAVLQGGEKTRSIYAPTDPGEGLSSAEQAAVLELKQKHPAMGPAQIRAQLKRFKGWRVSIKAIAP